MRKTTAPQGNREFWPGTGIVKSTGNAFTHRPERVLATPQELAKARSQAAAWSNEQQREAGKGFGHVTMGGLSKRAQKQLKSTPQSITIAPRGSSQGDRIKRGGI
jgi:hypothetical protein